MESSDIIVSRDLSYVMVAHDVTVLRDVAHDVTVLRDVGAIRSHRVK